MSSQPQRTVHEQEDILAVLIGGANILFSLVSHWFKSSALKYPPSHPEPNSSLIFGLVVGAAFIFAGTQLRRKERAQPLLIASVVMAVFFSGRFWAAPAKELFPSGILVGLRYM